MCPHVGDEANGSTPRVYGVPEPAQVTAEPSPISQLASTGVTVAVTDTPGTLAVVDREPRLELSSHIQVGNPTMSSRVGLVLIIGDGTVICLTAISATSRVCRGCR